MNRKELDTVSLRFAYVLAVMISLITVLIALILIWKSLPLYQIASIPELLFSNIWQPV